MLLQVIAGCAYLQIFRHLHLCSAYAWTVDVFDIVGPLVGQTTAVVNSQIYYCGDVWTMWLWCIMAHICNRLWGSLWGFVKLAGTRSRSGPVQWIRYWSDPSTSLSKDLTCFMLWDDGCMILWQESFGVHLAFCRVALFQRCSHYEMPVSFLSVWQSMCQR